MWSITKPDPDETISGTEVVVMSQMNPVEVRPGGRSCPASPAVVESIYKSTNVHVGDKYEYVTIEQTVENKEMLKSQFVGLELVSPVKGNRLRCSVAVFVCWTFIVAFGLGLYLFQVLTQESLLEDLGLNETWYFYRDDWQAMPEYDRDYLKLPLKNVVIGHSSQGYCTDRYNCTDSLMVLQADNQRRGFLDIVPNFLVGGNGLIFEGRGANVQAAMVWSWNTKSICIMFIGDYRVDEPDSLQFEHVNILLEQLVKKGVLVPDFELYGQCQLAHDTLPPGPKLLDRLGELLHWNPVNKNKCLRL